MDRDQHGDTHLPFLACGFHRAPPWLHVLCFREKLRNESEYFMFGALLGYLARRHLLILTEAKNKININSRCLGSGQAF